MEIENRESKKNALGYYIAEYVLEDQSVFTLPYVFNSKERARFYARKMLYNYTMEFGSFNVVDIKAREVMPILEN